MTCGVSDRLYAPAALQHLQRWAATRLALLSKLAFLYHLPSSCVKLTQGNRGERVFRMDVTARINRAGSNAVAPLTCQARPYGGASGSRKEPSAGSEPLRLGAIKLRARRPYPSVVWLRLGRAGLSRGMRRWRRWPVPADSSPRAALGNPAGPGGDRMAGGKIGHVRCPTPRNMVRSCL